MVIFALPSNLYVMTGVTDTVIQASDNKSLEEEAWIGYSRSELEEECNRRHAVAILFGFMDLNYTVTP